MKTLKESKLTRANKDHICDFCGGRIKLGDFYEKSTHVFDDCVYNWKAHPHCLVLANKLNLYDDALDDEGVTMDHFMDVVSECYIDLMTKDIPKDIKNNESVLHLINHLKHVNFQLMRSYVYHYYNK